MIESGFPTVMRDPLKFHDRRWTDEDWDEIAPVTRDAWQVRDEFFVTEPWAWDGFVYWYGQIGAFPHDLRGSTRDVSVSRRDFEAWQKLLRRAMKLPRRDWHKLRAQLSSAAAGTFDDKVWLLEKGLRDLKTEERTDRGKRVLVGVVEARTALDAIAATITIDQLLGYRFGYCKYCGRPFKKRRDKLYCSRRHASAMAVRRWRSRKRKKQVKP